MPGTDAAVLLEVGGYLGSVSRHHRPAAGGPAVEHQGRAAGAAITSILTTAREHRASTVVIETLDFDEPAAAGANARRRPHGDAGPGVRHQVAGIPAARFRDRLTHMACNTGIAVIAVDPAYTSRWAAQHWLAPIQQHHPKLPATTRQRS